MQSTGGTKKRMGIASKPSNAVERYIKTAHKTAKRCSLSLVQLFVSRVEKGR